MRSTLITVSTLLNALIASWAPAKNPFPRPALAAGVCWTLDQFNLAGGTPPLAIDFDRMPCGEVLDGRSICGVKFQRVNAPLEVVCAEDTYTPDGFRNSEHPERRTLRATSGQMLLSPGGRVLAPGPNPAVEDDDIVMTFEPPVACVGFDHISQYADGMSYTRVTVVAVDGRVLYESTLDIGSSRWLIDRRDQSFEPSPSDQPDRTTDFWGFVSSAANIREVRIDETDDNQICPDANIGIDSIRFAPVWGPCGSGDLTGDGHVASQDVAVLLTLLGDANPLQPDGTLRWSSADVNRDGTIDTADVIELVSHTR